MQEEVNTMILLLYIRSKADSELSEFTLVG
jgi:hypothetical protein